MLSLVESIESKDILFFVKDITVERVWISYATYGKPLSTLTDHNCMG